MELEVDRIYSSTNRKGGEGEAVFQGPADIIVKMTNGAQYVASFITYSDIDRLQQQHRKSGNYLHGAYFWSKNIVLVKDCQPATVNRIVQHLLEEGDFQEAFEKI